MNKNEKIKAFNPNSIGQKNDGMYGLPFSVDECECVMMPVPWEVTVSYGGGTADGPEAIREASYQVDLYDPSVNNAWKKGIGLDEVNPLIRKKSDDLRPLAEKYIDALSEGADAREHEATVWKIDEGCRWLAEQVRERAGQLLDAKKTVGLIGGDHSTPLGLMQALAERHDSFGILQIDAHADLRNAYEGFAYSHASIMFNALKIPQVSKLVQAGIRDYCEEELDIITNDKRVDTFFDRDIRHAMYRGETWDHICNRIVSSLPQKVYLSFDIDGLDPKLCPNTGTPVAGGFEAEQVLYLIEKVVATGKNIIAFDLNEVSPGETEWDANVAARLLYRIANLVMKSQGK